MTTQTKHPRFATAAALWAGLFLLPALASAHPHSHPRLKARIEALEANLALQTNSLKSQLDYQARRTENMMPGSGGMCGDPCTVDSDDDGIGDCEDYCPCDPNTADGDTDAIPDCADPCPDDATNACMDPCNQDSDGDGVNDCEDVCPWDPAAAVDADGDGIPDCQDFCPNDPQNLCFEPCVLDTDGDGVNDCEDGCPWAPTTGADGSTFGCIPPGATP